MTDAAHGRQEVAMLERVSHERKEFRFTDRDFHYLRQLVNRETGIVITAAKREMVYSRLSRRLRALNLTDFEDYCRLLEKDEQGELNAFINAITTNLTYAPRRGIVVFSRTASFRSSSEDSHSRFIKQQCRVAAHTHLVGRMFNRGRAVFYRHGDSRGIAR